MIELPENLLPFERNRINDLRKLADKAGPATAFAAEQVVSMLVKSWQHNWESADKHRAERDRLESIIVRLGGGFDRRGLDTEPRGLIVQHGIHTVVEDSR